MPKIAIVGEAWGADEEKERAPFVGWSGQELTRMLSKAGIMRSDCFLSNVFNLRPKGIEGVNAIANLCTDERSTDFPPIAKGKYLRPCYFPEVRRLLAELRAVRPNITILLGNTAAWALLKATGITKLRGFVVESAVIPGLKCLPTYHPAAVLREYSLRPTTILDLGKARRESAFPELRRPPRTVYIEPSLSEMEWFYDQHLRFADEIIFDIETRGDQITCIGFAPSHAVALVVPFSDSRKPSGSFWPTLEAERAAWQFVRRVLALPCRKAGQNTLYDITFLWKGYGITVNNYDDDSMLLHHALQPESEKSLGYLGSIYTDEGPWKMMRTRGEDATIKRED